MKGYLLKGVMYEGVTMGKPEFKGDYFLHYGPQKRFEETLASAPRLTAIGFADGEEGVREYEREDQFWTGTAWTKHLVDGKVKPGTKTRTVAQYIASTK